MVKLIDFFIIREMFSEIKLIIKNLQESNGEKLLLLISYIKLNLIGPVGSVLITVCSPGDGVII